MPADHLDDPDVAAALATATVRGHDVKPLMRSLLARGLDLTGLELDTAIAAYLLDPAEARYELALLVERYTRFAAPADDPAATGQLDLDGTQADPPAGRALGAGRPPPRRADPVSLADQGMAELYRTIENPLGRVLARMEHAGVAVDRANLRSSISGSAPRSCGWGRSCARSSGATTSTSTRRSSCASCCTPPAGGARHHADQATKTGASTDAQTLEKLRDQWPEFIGPLLQYREVEKLRGTYGEGLLAEVAADGRIHATFNQTVARTGRLSSDRPNLHNIPVRRDEGRMFRRAFIAAPGGKLLVADYNQIELRCIAHLAADPGLIAAFTSGEDIHNATAARVFDVAPADVTLDQRSKAKMVSYGLAYGMEAYGLGPATEHPDRGGGEDPRRLLRGVPQREGVHGQDGRRGPQAGVHRDPVRPAPADPGAAQRQLADPPGRRAPGDERRDPGARRRHLQGRPRPGRRGAGGARRAAGSSSRSTTR